MRLEGPILARTKPLQSSPTSGHVLFSNQGCNSPLPKGFSEGVHASEVLEIQDGARSRQVYSGDDESLAFPRFVGLHGTNSKGISKTLGCTGNLRISASFKGSARKGTERFEDSRKGCREISSFDGIQMLLQPRRELLFGLRSNEGVNKSTVFGSSSESCCRVNSGNFPNSLRRPCHGARIDRTRYLRLLLPVVSFTMIAIPNDVNRCQRVTLRKLSKSVHHKRLNAHCRTTRSWSMPDSDAVTSLSID